jgi:hypothetical protein
MTTAIVAIFYFHFMCLFLFFALTRILKEIKHVTLNPCDEKTKIKR